MARRKARWSDAPAAKAIAEKATVLNAAWLAAVCYLMASDFLVWSRSGLPGVDARFAAVAVLIGVMIWGFMRLRQGPSILAGLPALAMTILASIGLIESLTQRSSIFKVLDSPAEWLTFGGLFSSYVAYALYAIAWRKLSAGRKNSVEDVFE